MKKLMTLLCVTQVDRYEVYKVKWILRCIVKLVCAIQCSTVARQSTANTEAVCRRDGAVDGKEGNSDWMSDVSMHCWRRPSWRQSVSQLPSPSFIHSGSYFIFQPHHIVTATKQLSSLIFSNYNISQYVGRP